MSYSYELEATVHALLAPGKGLLAADESFPTIEKRFDKYKIPSTEENRRAYREMLFTTPQLSKAISGVILFDETLRQQIDGVSAVAALVSRGIVPGIKVDKGAVPLPGFPSEKITLGLDGLRERLAEYRQMGAQFTKWRAVIAIGPRTPTDGAIESNATALALFASLSQEAGLVPIVEPEVLMDGDHSLARCEAVVGATLEAVFRALVRHRVVLEHMLLKSGMVLPGEDSSETATSADIAEATLRCFRRYVPAAVPGIVFLSGGQSAIPATRNLDAFGKAKGQPWKVTFSYGRALQDPAMKAWRGRAEAVRAGQAALGHRAKCNGQAVRGLYSAQLEKSGR